jgi:hypothetical protein
MDMSGKRVCSAEWEEISKRTRVADEASDTRFVDDQSFKSAVQSENP